MAKKKKSDLPFKVGQIVESRTYEIGYRGAWFRSKINGIQMRKHDELRYNLAFLDFPDEKRTWTKVYERAQDHDKNLKIPEDKPADLMIRPAFPRVYRESEAPDVNTISETIVVVNDDWKVGDLVDWWTDDCYWSGRITDIGEEGKCQIDLPPPPLGEGMSDEANSKDFRPSLDWSLEHGWIDSADGCCCRVVYPVKLGRKRGNNEDMLGAESIEMGNEPSVEKDSDDDDAAPESPLVSRASSDLLSLHRHKYKDVENQQQPLDKTVRTSTSALQKNIDLDSDSDSSSHDASGSSEDSKGKGELENGEPPKLPDQPPSFEAEKETQPRATTVEPGSANGTLTKDHCSVSPETGYTLLGNDEADQGRLVKKRRIEEMCLNSMFSDTIEASVLELEEILQRVKWLKGMLQDEDGKASSDASRPPWKFLEHRA